MSIPGSDPFASIQHTTDSHAAIQERLAQKQAVLIDVRETEEWGEGHLRQAELVPLSEIRHAADDLETRQTIEQRIDKDTIVYCHCKSGGRVMMATLIMKSWGYDIRPMRAGFDELVDSGFEQA